MNNFARGKSLTGQRYFARRDTHTVVRHSDETPPSLSHLNADRVCRGIQRIFDQFFHYTCRSLNDFTSSDLLLHFRGKNTDAHAFTLPQR